MTSSSRTGRTSLSAILLLAVVLLLLGGAAAVWALLRYPEAARLVGLAPPADALATAAVPATPLQPALNQPSATPLSNLSATEARVAALEGRLARVESATARAEGSAGRADALLVAFAARRAIDRGVALGYLEPLLTERFGTTHPQAVATIVSGARQPVRLDQLSSDFLLLAPRLKSAPEGASLWQNIRRELGGLVTIRRADQPNQRPVPTYDRAAARLAAGQVDQALAEAMRLPGIASAPRWVDDARRYVTMHRALDQIEAAALIGR